MVGVIHVHPENLPDLGQRHPVGRFLNPAGAIDRWMGRRVRQHGEHPRGGTATVRVALRFSWSTVGWLVVGFAGAVVMMDIVGLQ